jgi:hypothetical protein
MALLPTPKLEPSYEGQYVQRVIFMCQIIASGALL